MHRLPEVLGGIGMILGALAMVLSLCKISDKPTPKPGRDYDERGRF